jgi:hypothetical protein
MRRKKLITLIFLLVGFVLPTLLVQAENAIFLNETSPIETSVTSSLDNVTIEMVTELPSYREDNIPSVLPGESFTVRFNITNNADQILNMLELSTETNEFGGILNPSTSTKDVLAVGESWLTEEQTILTVSDGGGAGTTSSALDLAIVLDQSGSMGEEIQALTNELISVVDEIDSEVPNLRVGLLLFGGTPHYNPFYSPSLIHPLTSDVSEIVDVLSRTDASGSQEPWGDALYCAKNNLEWRSEAVKLVILITDEPNNSGSLIQSTAQLTNLYHQYAENEFILCTILASGWFGTTKEELMSGAEITEGTFIEIGSEYPQTGDIPEIIGELIVLYAAEMDLKLTVQLSHESEPGVREGIEETFVVLLDDLPPDIDTWVYFSEDFLTEDLYVNIMSEVKDVTGVSFVEIYYKFDEALFWSIANATVLFNDSYCLSLEYDDQKQHLHYQIYTKDWLGNEIYDEEQTINLASSFQYSIIPVSTKKDIILTPNQNTVFRLTGDLTDDSYGFIIGNRHVTYNIIAADVEDAIIFLDNNASNYDAFNIPAGHTVKIALMATDYVNIVIANVVPQIIDFNETFKVEIDADDVYLYKIDNAYSNKKDRMFYADSRQVQTGIYVIDATNMEYLFKDSTIVEMEEKEYYMLVVADYHTGEIDVGFVFKGDYTPYDHYYTQASSWPLIVTLFGLAALLGLLKRRQR